MTVTLRTQPDRPTTHHTPRSSRLLARNEVMERCGIRAASTLHDWIRAGRFPAPIHLAGGRTARWLEADLESWLADQLAAAGRDIEEVSSR
ncbi:MAG: AlpA family phage regulatory protein [Desulfurivibrio sp.]|nr:AlpA family phage regulatory protein [Desulfurivibrio sp.]